MSMVNSETVVCPTCGQTTTATIWSSLNTNIDPEAKERLLKGTLLTSVCPKCEAKNDLYYPMLFHDPDKKVMVYLAPSKEDRKEAETTFRAKKGMAAAFKDYIYRIVTTPNEMREKAIILECGMDDRVVEVLKLVILGLVESENPNVNVSGVWFYTKDQRFFVQILGDHPCTAEVYWEDYYKIKELIKSESLSNKEYYINHAWATAIWKKIENRIDEKSEKINHIEEKASECDGITSTTVVHEGKQMVTEQSKDTLGLGNISKKKKRQKVKVVILSIVAIIVLVVSIIYLFIPLSKYIYANRMLTAGEYSIAYHSFSKLDGFFDSEEKMIDTKYLQAINYRENGNYETANVIFESLGDYKDSKTLIHYHEYRLSSTFSATCTVDGHETYTCTGCDDSYVSVIEASHDYKSTTQAPTCTNTGEIRYTCSKCDYSYAEIIEKEAHKYNPATCYKAKTCSICGEMQGSALGHSNTVICTRCGENTFETREYSGVGPGNITGIDLPAGIYNITFEHSGSSNFIVHGNINGIWVNQIGTVSYVCRVSSPVANPIKYGYINIEMADGYWTVTIEAVGN